MSLVSEALKQLQNKTPENNPVPGPGSTLGKSPKIPYLANTGKSGGRWKIAAAVLGASLVLALIMAGIILILLQNLFPEVARTAIDHAPAINETNKEIPPLQLELIPPIKTMPKSEATEPDQPGEAKTTTSTWSLEKVEERYQVTLIAKGANSAMAIVNNRIAVVGDQLPGNARVVDIQASHIKLEIEGEVFSLRPLM